MVITINPTLKAVLPELVLSGFLCDVAIAPSSHELLLHIDNELAQVAQGLTPDTIRDMPNVKLTKDAYRKLGKDPNRYRPSAESLLRRVANGRGLYRLSNVVDILNLMSVKTGYSICGYDFDNVIGSVSLGIGEPEEPYIGIGRGDINIELLPVFRDELSAFGTPTSDSVRTMVTNRTKRFLMIFVGFAVDCTLTLAAEEAQSLLSRFAGATNFDSFIIKAS